MTQDHDPIYDLMRAVDRFADWRADQLAASVIHRLQRMPVTGIFGDDFAYRTVWDEYCHECQFGPHDMLDLAWDATVNPLIAAVLEKVPSEEMALMDSAEAADLRNGDMATSIRLAITGKAMDRNLDRFARP